jgi:hypothetical protein
MLSSNEPWAYMAPAVDAGARLVHAPAVDAAPGPSGRASSGGIDGAGKAAYKRVRDHDAHGHETATLTYREGTTPGSKYEGFAAPPSPLVWARRHRARGAARTTALYSSTRCKRATGTRAKEDRGDDKMDCCNYLEQAALVLFIVDI